MKKSDIKSAWQDPRIKDLMNPIVAFLKSKKSIFVSARGITGKHSIWHTSVGDTVGSSTKHELLIIKYRGRTLYEERYDLYGTSWISRLDIKRIGKYRHLLIGLREEYEKIWKEAEDSRRESLLKEKQRKDLNIKARIDSAFGRTDR